MNRGGEALIGLVGAQRAIAEEVIAERFG